MSRLLPASLVAASLLLPVGCADDPDASPGDDESLTAGVPRITGTIHTSGSHFVDQSGHSLRLIGINLLQNITNSSVADNVSSWGMNFVRVVVYWSLLEPTKPGGFPLVHKWDDGYLAQLKAEVDALTHKGIAVVLDMHQYQWSPALSGQGMPAWLYPDRIGLSNSSAKCAFFSDVGQSGTPIAPQEGFVAAWKHLLTAFADDPMVIGADLLNEPTGNANGCNHPTYDPDGFYIKVAKAVRSTNPKLVLLVEDNAYESYLGSNRKFFLSNDFKSKMDAAGLTDWAYSWHFYPNPYSAGKPLLDDHIGRASGWNVPLWIGEFNPTVGSKDGGHATPNPNWKHDLALMMPYFKLNNLSWSFWEYQGGLGLLDGSGHPNQDLLSGLQAGY
jgi:hypothetical protein